MSGLSGANPYLARALTNDLVRQAKVAQECEARAERAKLDDSELRGLERGPNGHAIVRPARRRGRSA
ncbi:MAG: hypothetical protein L0227_08800 [Chloroflexi bacterium]|nr:hypothetical protein [Chloroflexota bacterium]